MMRKLSAEIQLALAGMPRKNVPAFRVLRRAWSGRLKDRPGPSIVALAQQLRPLGPWERGFAYELILHHRGALEALKPNDITLLGRGIRSWGDVDAFACFVAGPAWRERRIPDSMVVGWTRSPNRWWRRAALVSTVALNSRARGGTGDTARTLRICRLLVRDRDDMVVKALSWALRELSKRDRAAVELFVKRHRAALPSRVVREVECKLRTGLKNPRRLRPL